MKGILILLMVDGDQMAAHRKVEVIEISDESERISGGKTKIESHTVAVTFHPFHTGEACS